MRVEISAINNLIDETPPEDAVRIKALQDARQAVIDIQELTQQRIWDEWVRLGVQPT